MALDRLYNDYKQFFTEHATVSEDAKLDYAQQIIDILDRNTANVHDDELRFYMNEMVIFSLNEAMKDGNNRVKPVDEKAALQWTNFTQWIFAKRLMHRQFNNFR